MSSIKSDIDVTEITGIDYETQKIHIARVSFIFSTLTFGQPELVMMKMNF